MYGIDISSWQDGIELSKGNYDFAIIKATEGIGYKDRCFSKWALQLTKLDKLIGCYHFARPDLNGTTSGMINEADYFVETLEKEDLIGRSILVLDWETEPMDREELVDTFLNRVYSQTGVKPFIYGSKSKLINWKSWSCLQRFPIWMAMWPTLKRYYVGEDIEDILLVPNKVTVPWTIWQYSAVGRYPDFSGNIDLDLALITPTVWKEYAGISVNKPEQKELITPDMQWAIDKGIFVGYGDGRYGPNDPLTRSQAATIIRKLMEES